MTLFAFSFSTGRLTIFKATTKLTSIQKKKKHFGTRIVDSENTNLGLLNKEIVVFV